MRYFSSLDNKNITLGFTTSKQEKQSQSRYRFIDHGTNPSRFKFLQVSKQLPFFANHPKVINYRQFQFVELNLESYKKHYLGCNRQLKIPHTIIYYN